MNAPVSTLTRASGTILPGDKQREHDEALVAFWNDGSARDLHALEGGGIVIAGKRSMPDSLECECDSYAYPVWFAFHSIEGSPIVGEGATALGALADMMIRAEAKAAEFAAERYEDNMAGRGS